MVLKVVVKRDFVRILLHWLHHLRAAKGDSDQNVMNTLKNLGNSTLVHIQVMEYVFAARTRSGSGKINGEQI
ncbi:hypothetical protein YC2023_043641 [Brassica napus]